jgi:predicted acylesterase/phospholipase RssA
VITAIRMSITLPILFTPIVYDDCYYVDGGLYEALPIGYLDQFNDDLRDTLAIHTAEDGNRDNKDKKNDHVINSFGSYIMSMIDSLMDKATLHAKVSSKIKVFPIHQPSSSSFSLYAIDIDNLSFDIDMDQVRTSIKFGYDLIKTFFEQESS